MAIGDKLFIADKNTLDAVKVDTTALLAKGGGIDWSKYNRIHNIFSSYNPPAGASATFYTAYSITGKGFIDCLFFTQSGGASGDLLVQIIVDGEVLIEGKSTLSKWDGVTTPGTFFEYGGSLYFDVGVNPLNNITTSTFPSRTTTGNFYVHPISRPIFFNTSLEVKVRRLNANTPSISYVAKGGIL